VNKAKTIAPAVVVPVLLIAGAAAFFIRLRIRRRRHAAEQQTLIGHPISPTVSNIIKPHPPIGDSGSVKELPTREIAEMDEQRGVSEVSNSYFGRRPSNVYTPRRGTTLTVVATSMVDPKALEVMRDDSSSYHTAASADKDGITAGDESAEPMQEDGTGEEKTSVLRWITALLKP